MNLYSRRVQWSAWDCWPLSRTCKQIDGNPACGWASPMDQTNCLNKNSAQCTPNLTTLAVEVTLKNHTSAETSTISISCQCRCILFHVTHQDASILDPFSVVYGGCYFFFNDQLHWCLYSRWRACRLTLQYSIGNLGEQSLISRTFDSWNSRCQLIANVANWF